MNNVNQKDFKSLRQYLRKNQTFEEKRLWQYLRNRKLEGYKFRRQHGIQNYILDFYCPALRLGIEIDGSHHMNDSGQFEYDLVREELLSECGVYILHFTNRQIRDSIELVIVEIIRNLPSP
jgi:very-short-patch-repair endonuclease